MDHLRQLQSIIQAASREIMWINDCEEEELLYDWSDRNTNIAQKQEAFSVSPAPGAGPLPPGGAGCGGVGAWGGTRLRHFTCPF